MDDSISILGSTGSIGRNTLEVARHLQIPIVALAAKSNVSLLEEQTHLFHPKLVVLEDPYAAAELQKRIPKTIQVLSGKEGLAAAAVHPEATMVISAISGTSGIFPTFKAIEAGKKIGLANKEVLVSGGSLTLEYAAHYGATLIPIDSEHSAIFQCLQGEKNSQIEKIILTASGGPFRTWNFEQLANITPEKALSHPTWSMGPKITIDSSTLMNKGLEVIEAYWLFNMPAEQIEVVVHPQSIIHSMVEFCDGSTLAQLGIPDMKVPIQYALTYPKRLSGKWGALNWKTEQKLDFYPVDFEKFPCLKLAYWALERGQSYLPFLNAANEILVMRFLNKEISWLNISQKLHELLDRHVSRPLSSLEDIFEIDTLARQAALCA